MTADVMNEWEESLEAKETWSNMTPHQRDQTSYSQSVGANSAAALVNCVP